MSALTRTSRVATVLLTLIACVTRASATEVRCIEESKYKYLYQLFEGGSRGFADYFGIDPGRLPDPEFCRAALLSGSTGEKGKDEVGDLIRIIVQNRGWLSTLYLSSPGGSGSPFTMAFIVRKLRVKTVVAHNVDKRMAYSPDFAPTTPPASLWVPTVTAAVCFLKNQIGPRGRGDNVVAGIMRPEPFQPSYDDGFDRPGQDLRSVNLPRQDARLCQQHCEKDPKCRAWTYNGPPAVGQPVCWLKSAVGEPEHRGPGFTSGVIRPDPFRPTFERNTDFRGNDYSRINLPKPDARLCQQHCQEDSQCRAWAYNGPGPYTLVSGWDRYRKTQREIAGLAAPYDECASSCSFIHVGGVDRSGRVNLHRPSPARHMAEFEARQRAGNRVRRFYEHMDAGDELFRAWETTPAVGKLRGVPASRFPRYLNDYLLSKCRNDAEALQRREAELIKAADKTALAAVHEQRRAAEMCIAGEFERARLTAFDQLCGMGCDARKMQAAIENEIVAALGRDD